MDEVREFITGFSDDDLLEMVENHHDNYTPEALEIARQELRKRNIAFQDFRNEKNGRNLRVIHNDAMDSRFETVYRKAKIYGGIASVLALSSLICWRFWHNSKNEFLFLIMIVGFVLAFIFAVLYIDVSKCPHCGHSLKIAGKHGFDGKFCPYCGVKVRK